MDILQKHRTKGRFSALTFLVGCTDADKDDCVPLITVMWQDDGNTVRIMEVGVDEASPKKLAAALRQLSPWGCAARSSRRSAGVLIASAVVLRLEGQSFALLGVVATRDLSFLLGWVDVFLEPVGIFIWRRGLLRGYRSAGC